MRADMLSADADTATCRIGNDAVRTNFAQHTTDIQETSP